MFSSAHAVDRLAEMPGDMKLIEDDLALTLFEMLLYGGDVRIPHIHGDRLNAVCRHPARDLLLKDFTPCPFTRTAA